MRLDRRVLHSTGAWAIRGASGMFFLSAGHCFESYHLVYARLDLDA